MLPLDQLQVLRHIPTPEVAVPITRADFVDQVTGRFELKASNGPDGESRSTFHDPFLVKLIEPK